jgi:hypothetical protein
MSLETRWTYLFFGSCYALLVVSVRLASSQCCNVIHLFVSPRNNDEIPVQRSITYPASTQEDFWQYNINACPSNCTLHGACKYGYCFCDDGRDALTLGESRSGGMGRGGVP